MLTLSHPNSDHAGTGDKAIDFDLTQHHLEVSRSERREALRALFTSDSCCRPEDDLAIKLPLRLAYTAKALICCLFDMRYRRRQVHAIRLHFINAETGKPDVVEVSHPTALPRWRANVHEDRVPLQWKWPPMTAWAARRAAEDRFYFHDNDVGQQHVTVATMRSHDDGYSWSATWVEVPAGLFRWGYRVESDGDSFM